MRASAALLVSLLLLGCEAPSRPLPQPRLPDKQALYADASLVPTREGERIRRELALAGELGHALELLPLAATRVDVELEPRASVTVIAQRRDHDHEHEPDHALERDIHALATAIVPGEPEVHVQLVSPPTAAVAPASLTKPEPLAKTSSRVWALSLTCLGLGLSLGVTGERLLARRRMRMA